MAAPSSAVVPALTLLLSLPLLYFFLVPRFLPRRQIAISLPDVLNDLSLFYKAIAMESANFSRRNHLPAAKSHLSASLRPPRIAFLFLTNSPSTSPPCGNASTPMPTPNITTSTSTLTPAPRSHLSAPSSKTASSLPSAPSAPPPPSSPPPPRHRDALRPANTYFALVSQHYIPLHSFNYLYNFLSIYPDCPEISNSPATSRFSTTSPHYGTDTMPEADM